MLMVSYKSELKIKELINKKKLLLPMIKEDFLKKKLNKCSKMLKNSLNKIKFLKKKSILKMPSNLTFIV
jgi:hypothetical protein